MKKSKDIVENVLQIIQKRFRSKVENLVTIVANVD